jgi:mono/diheme cytochrome c family protein
MVFASAAIVALAAGSTSPTVAERTPMPHAPSDSQVDLGRRWFAASCETCHAVDEIASADFRAKWGGRTAFDLFQQISRTMPEPEPGSLPRRAYIDIVAYLMRQNGVVAVAPLADDDAALAGTILQFAPPPAARR